MLEPREIGIGMAIEPTFKTLGNKREQVRLYGNAVTPPAGEVLVSALAEAIHGQDLTTV